LEKIHSSGLVVEAGKTFLLEKEEVSAFADRSGLFIQAV